MQVIIDNIDSLVEPDTERTLGEFLKNLSQWLGDHNRTPVRIVVDGRTFDSQSSGELLASDLAPIKILEVTSVDNNEKIVDILRGIYEQVPILSARLAEAAAILRAGSTDRGLKLFSETVDTWQLANEALMKVSRDIGVDIARLTVTYEQRSLTAEELVRQLTELVAGCNASIQSRDALAVADAIEYELMPRIRFYTDIVQSLSRSARKKLVNE